MTPLKDRFWSKVDKAGDVPGHKPRLGKCWVWTAGRNGVGYGALQVFHAGRWVAKLAHRISWELAYGAAPTLCCLHKCDNTRCVRPSHLFQGTRSQNAEDKCKKARQSRGERNGGKLRDGEVEKIRQIYRRGGIQQKELAKRFGISRAQMSLIVNGKSWTHLKVFRLPGDGRQRNGKLKPEDVERIRARYAEGGITFRVLSAEYGVCESLLCGIVNGKRWVSK